MAQTETSADLKEAPWADVIRTAVEELKSFVQQEMRLLSSELGDKVKQVGTGAGMFGAAGFMGFLAAGALTAAFVLGLSLVLAPWLAALVVALVYGAIAGVLTITGKKKVQEATPFVPQQAIQSVQDTKEQMQQAWERGSQESEGGNENDTDRAGGSYSYVRRSGSSANFPRY